MTAAAIVSLFPRRASALPRTQYCYSLVGPDYGISIAAVYRLGEDGQLQGVKGAGGLSPANASAQQRSQEAATRRPATRHRRDSFG